MRFTLSFTVLCTVCFLGNRFLCLDAFILPDSGDSAMTFLVTVLSHCSFFDQSTHKLYSILLETPRAEELGLQISAFMWYDGSIFRHSTLFAGFDGKSGQKRPFHSVKTQKNTLLQAELL